MCISLAWLFISQVVLAVYVSVSKVTACLTMWRWRLSVWMPDLLSMPYFFGFTVKSDPRMSSAFTLGTTWGNIQTPSAPLLGSKGSEFHSRDRHAGSICLCPSPSAALSMLRLTYFLEWSVSKAKLKISDKTSASNVRQIQTRSLSGNLL